MLNLIDIEKGLYGVSYKKRRHFILFILSTMFAVALVILLMLTSKQKYTLELIFTILISIAYLLYLVFYFTVIRRVLQAELRFYEGASKAELSEYDVEIHSISEEIKEHNGLEYYVLEARVDENLKEEDKIFYVPTKFSFKKNQKATIQVYGSVVINVELRK